MERARGFILVEIMVAVSIVVVVMGMILSVIAAGRDSWQIERARLMVTKELRRGVDLMTREMVSTQIAELAELPTAPAVGGWGPWVNAPVTFRVLSVIEAPAGSGNYAIETNGTGAVVWTQPITYQVANNQIQRVQNGVTRILANGVQQLQFRRQAANPVIEMNVQVQQNIDKRNGGGVDIVKADSLNTQLRLRN